MTSTTVTHTAAYPVASHHIPPGTLREGRYSVRFARSQEELDELLGLRFEIFNVELGEGLDTSWETGLDRDPFDAVCHHLIVIDNEDERIVGTYRMQTASMARGHIGFYSDGEYDLGDLPEEVRQSAVEVGRACVALEHRNTQVLFLLWKGLAMYTASNQLRFLFGCCSLTSQDPAEGQAMLEYLREKDHLHPSVWLEPRPDYRCVVEASPDESGPSDASYSADELLAAAPSTRVHVPKLFRIYLRHGAKVCSPPAIDREFKTIDFLVLFDVAAMDEKKVRTFFG